MTAIPFSILIPTWNNLPFLKLCCRSIKEHSQGQHQIILHINDGSDGTLDWVKAEGYDFTHSSENIGICRAVNLACDLARHDHIVYLNDDMYVLPDWDTALQATIQELEGQMFMLSATMIEPTDSGNPSVIVGNYGRKLDDFREAELLANFRAASKADWNGASWPPLLIHRDLWHAVGGFSIEFSPGMYSDPDLTMKLWHLGCRIFKGVADSRVYHFQAASTGRVKKNNGRLQFMQKWGLPSSHFYRHWIKMGQPYQGVLPEPPSSLFARLKAKWNQLWA